MERTNEKLGKSEQDPALANDEPFLAEPGSTSNKAPSGEGSVGYRIAAMVAMFLLALAGFVFWYFSRK